MNGSKLIKSGGEPSSPRAVPPRADNPGSRLPAGRAPEARDTARADGIVADAQAHAESLRARAEEDARAAITAAAGKGEQEGRDSVADVQALAERLAQQLDASLEHDALEAAVEAARELAAAEVKHRPSAIVDIVRKALASAKHQKEIFVRVSPRDAALVKERKRELLDVLSRARDMDVREDPLLAPGSCVVETEIGIIDAQLQTQLDVLTQLLVGGGE